MGKVTRPNIAELLTPFTGQHSVTPPIGWLEDYWMGRYYGFIEPPMEQTPELTTVPPRMLARNGAAPYDGPPRPTAAWEK
jgi:hypothetical protein